MATKPDTVIFYPFPFPGMGHIVPMVELAKLFLRHNFHAAVVLIHTPHNLAPNSDFISTISADFPPISFHQLPPHSALDHPTNPVVAALHRVTLNNPNLRDFLRSHSDSHTVRALVLDFFSTDPLDVAAEFALPSYVFFSSGASGAAAALYMPTLFQKLDKNLDEMGDEPIETPGCPPIPATHFPSELRNRNSHGFNRMIYHFDRMPDAHGILVNTFESLEARAVGALRDGLCTPGRPTPPVHCIGPLIAGPREETHECIAWLDTKPKDSVALLCFGSMGTFKAEQLAEIAKGLEASEQSFIWVVRTPLKDGERTSTENLMAEPELETLLPSGFLERTKKRGFVAKKWVPQTAVLRHEAVGGFVTHGGWNSILESIVSGVPMIVWPLYAEQRLNKVFLVEEMRLGVEMKGYDEEIVRAEEVERKVRWLMASDGGKELRERSEAMRKAAVGARSAGGSSEKDFLDVVAALRSRG